MVRARTVGLGLVVAALAAPASAAAHHAPGNGLGAAERHRAADLAGVSVQTLERRGNADSGLNGIRHTHVFDWRAETWSRGPDMQDGRWYPSVASLPNDEALIIGGGPTVAEIRTTSGGLRRLTGVLTPSSREYPFLQAAPDGRALLLGPARGLSLIDAGGLGALSAFGNRDAIHRSYGSYAPYDIGRFLVAGGGSVTEDGLSGVPSRTATTVDTRTGTPLGAATASMNRRRRQHNLTVLADGSALATGGQSTNGGGGLVDLANAVYAAERWDPATGAWTELAPAAVARQYHSTALLLPDGRVLTGGGGICGVCHQVGYLRRDQEVFTPPYLYKQDGSGELAPRPEVTGAPGAIAYDGSFPLESPQAADIRKLGLVRLGAPTHGEDQSQRYVPLSFSASGTALTVSGPNNPNEAPAGHYMLFAVDRRRRALGGLDRRAAAHGHDRHAAAHAAAREPRARAAGDGQYGLPVE